MVRSAARLISTERDKAGDISYEDRNERDWEYHDHFRLIPATTADVALNEGGREPTRSATVPLWSVPTERPLYRQEKDRHEVNKFQRRL